PLRNVRVEFVPDVDPKVQAPTSSAYTDDNGHFQLTCDNQKPGAVMGKHNVVVLGGRTGPDQPKVTHVPSAYGLAISTPLQVEVTADKHTYDLPLRRDAKPRP